MKQGVYEAGGIPLNLPVVSLGETLMRPTAMLWRNLAAMAIEEMLRANPIDGVVLLGGCDKTIPALVMGAASVDLPAVVLPGGPMLTGTFRGQPLGCGTDVWRLSEEVRAGTLTQEQFTDLGVVDDPQSRALQHDGYGVHHGAAGRGPRPGAARDRRAARTGQPPARAGPRHRPAGRGDGGRGPPPQHGALPGLVPQRDRRPRRHRRLHQRGRAPAGDGRPARHRARAGRLRPHRVRRPAARRPAAGRPLPDGGPASRGRPDRRAAPGRGPARPDGADRHRSDPGQLPGRRRDLGPRGDPAPRRAACSRTPGSRCSTATSRRTAR